MQRWAGVQERQNVDGTGIVQVNEYDIVSCKVAEIGPGLHPMGLDVVLLLEPREQSCKEQACAVDQNPLHISPLLSPPDWLAILSAVKAGGMLQL
jgi:hypothetical protein